MQKRRRRTTVAALLAIGFVAIVAYLGSLYTQISAMIEQRRAALSSSIYSLPHPIQIGDDVDGTHLFERLQSLSYSPADIVETPGQYSKTGAGVAIYLRGFDKAAEHFAPSIVQVHIERGRVVAVSDASGSPTTHAVIEPEAIGRLVPGAPAERVEIRLSDQKPYLVGGLLATEDQFFYWHPGINPIRIVEAAIEDLRSHRFAQGASTLTQQLARTFLERRERTMRRKLDELAVALVLEIRLTKDQILERYINDVSMGAYAGAPINGMPQAARYFFNKDLAQVTPAEAATLIGMVQAPTLYDPRRHAAASTERRNVVLGLMRQKGVIDEATYAAAVASPIRLDRKSHLRRAPYFADYVIAQVKAIPGFNGDLSGLKVYTTLDAEIQDEAVHAVTANLERLEKSHRELHRSGRPSKLQTSSIVLDAHTGAIRALVGGRNYSETQFNRATSALRQPGSAFKPIVYLAALDPLRTPVLPSLTLASLLPDEQMSFGGWSPENYERTYQPQVTAVTALSESLNVPTAYIGSRLGPDLMVRTAHELGIPQNLEPVLPISIGAEETTLLDLTSAYQVFANAGMRSQPYAIESVLDAADHEIFRHVPQSHRVVLPEVAYLITGGLETVLKTGTGAVAGRMGLDVPAAGKTGTTQDYKDAWFIGYTPDLVCGVWVGFDTPESIGLTGAQAALPAWVEIIRESAPAEPQKFSPPSGIVMATIDPETGGLASPSCPRRMTLPFLGGSEPKDHCALHGGGSFEAMASRNWGGWRSTAVATGHPRPAPPVHVGVFGKVSKFFGLLFHRH